MTGPVSPPHDDGLASRAYLVRDAVVTSKRLSERDRKAAVAALAEIVSQARRAEGYEEALRAIAGQQLDAEPGYGATMSGVKAFARDVLASTSRRWAARPRVAANE